MNIASFALHRANAATFTLIFATAIGTPESDAQQRGAGARTTAGTALVEQAIRLADELELTQAQREELESIRVDVLGERTSQAARFMVLTSEVRAGIREPEALRQEFAALREGRAADRDAFRDRFTEVLTDDQREQLRAMTRRGALRQRGIRDGSRIERQRGLRRQGAPGRGRGGSRFRGRTRPGGR